MFTGRARLARNLLQNVLRRWYARLPEIVQTTQGLVDNAEEAKRAFAEGSLARVGACLRAYWAQKQCMAKGCEPAFISQIFRVLRDADLLHGESLCGAGGGGFMCLITKPPDAVEAVKEALRQGNARLLAAAADDEGRAAVEQINVDSLAFYSVGLDERGMLLELETE